MLLWFVVKLVFVFYFPVWYLVHISSTEVSAIDGRALVWYLFRWIDNPRFRPKHQFLVLGFQTGTSVSFFCSHLFDRISSRSVLNFRLHVEHRLFLSTF